MAFSVGKIKVRKHTCTYENITFDGICTMKQAKVLTDKELNKVLDVISLYAHAERNRAMVLLTHLCGLRVCELASHKSIQTTQRYIEASETTLANAVDLL